MLDTKLRRLVDPPLNAIARQLSKRGVTANQITVSGFGFALLAFASLALQYYTLALLFIGLNRLADGLDGAVARQDTQNGSDLGGFLDIVSDFVFYAGAVFFFAVGQPESALYAAFLIFCFMATASSFLAYAIIAAKRNAPHKEHKGKSFHYIGGLAEGSETIIFLVLICLLPQAFTVLASLFGILCLITAAGRIKIAIDDFG